MTSAATLLLLLFYLCVWKHCSASPRPMDSSWKPSSFKDFNLAANNNPCNPQVNTSLPTDTMLLLLGPLLSTFETTIKEALINDSSPGGAVLSLIYKDKMMWTGGFGLKDMKDPRLGVPDENTRFRIGSITKLFPALQTLMMRDSGTIKSLDDDIQLYYPEFKVQNPFQTERGITFRQLMSHMSGLARNAPCKGIFETGCNISDSEMTENIAGMKLMYPPGSQPVYSNLAFGLLGKVLTRAAKATSWDELLTKMVLQPLEMNDTGNSFDNYDPKKTAIGYYPDGSVADFIDIGWDASAGQSYSSTADLAKLMSLIFSDEKSSKEQLVDGESLREWTEPAFINTDETGFSYPWELDYSESLPLHAKDGVMNGYNAKFQMILGAKIGFILLQSCDGCKSHQVIIDKAMTMMSIMLGALIAKNMYAAPPIPPRPQEYEALYIAHVGIDEREITVNVSLQIFKSHPVLFIIKSNSTALLEWHDKDTFQVADSVILPEHLPCSTLSSGYIGAWVYFERDSGGKVVSLTLPGLTYGVLYERHI